MNYKHGDSNTRFHSIWMGLFGRCNYKKSRYYKKNISIDTKWIEYLNFKNDMYDSYLEHCALYGEKNTSIDRIDNNGNYNLANCKWSTCSEQAKNRKTNIILKYKDDVLCLSDMAKKYNINRMTLKKRLSNGIDIKDALKHSIQRKNASKYKLDGKYYTIKDLSYKYNILWVTLNNRIKRGWDIKRAVNTIVKIKGGR